MFRSHESIQSLSSQSHSPYQITFRSLVLFHAPLPSKPKTFCRDTLENPSGKALWESLTCDAAAGDWTVERFHESAEPFVKGKVANELKFSYTHARFIAFIRCSVREKLTSHPLSRQRRSLHIYVFFVDFTRFSADSFKALIQIKSNLVYFECVVLDNFFFLLRFRCCFMLLSADVVAVAVCCAFDSKLFETYIEQTFPERLLPKPRIGEEAKPIVI